MMCVMAIRGGELCGDASCHLPFCEFWCLNLGHLTCMVCVADPNVVFIIFIPSRNKHI